MSKIKDFSTLELGGKKYKLFFNLNVMAEAEEEFGGLENVQYMLESSTKSLKSVRFMLTHLINEGLPEGEKPFTENEVGKLVNLTNFQKINDSILKSINIATPETSGEAGKNEVDEESL